MQKRENALLPTEVAMTTNPRYRLYRFDRLGHIIGVKDLICYSDFDAIAKARDLATSEAQELWSSDKLLAVIKASHAA
jgi:hypothetical protein